MGRTPKRELVSLQVEWSLAAVEAVRFKDRLGRLGLWRTMHEMDAVVKQIGWETADLLESQRRSGKKVRWLSQLGRLAQSISSRKERKGGVRCRAGRSNSTRSI